MQDIFKLVLLFQKHGVVYRGAYRLRKANLYHYILACYEFDNWYIVARYSTSDMAFAHFLAASFLNLASDADRSDPDPGFSIHGDNYRLDQIDEFTIGLINQDGIILDMVKEVLKI